MNLRNITIVTENLTKCLLLNLPLVQLLIDLHAIYLQILVKNDIFIISIAIVKENLKLFTLLSHILLHLSAVKI